MIRHHLQVVVSDVELAFLRHAAGEVPLSRWIRKSAIEAAREALRKREATAEALRKRELELESSRQRNKRPTKRSEEKKRSEKVVESQDAASAA